MEKFNGSDDDVFKERAVFIKEERAELVKHHLWVLWTDYFKPEHLEKHPELHDIFWKATKAAGEAKKTNDAKVAAGPARPDRRDRQDLLGDQEGAERAAAPGRPTRARGLSQGEGQVLGAEPGRRGRSARRRRWRRAQVSQRP